MKKKKSAPKQVTTASVNGLHLWKVKTNLTSDGTHGHLWITTEKCDTKQAVAKAVRFERQNVGKSRTVYVDSLKYRGTIDA